MGVSAGALSARGPSHMCFADSPSLSPGVCVCVCVTRSRHRAAAAGAPFFRATVEATAAGFRRPHCSGLAPGTAHGQSQPSSTRVVHAICGTRRSAACSGDANVRMKRATGRRVGFCLRVEAGRETVERMTANVSTPSLWCAPTAKHPGGCQSQEEGGLPGCVSSPSLVLLPLHPTKTVTRTPIPRSGSP